MELNKYFQELIRDAIAKAAIIKRVKGTILAVTESTFTIQINSPLPQNDKQITIKNTTHMTASVGSVVWVYYWKNIADGFVLPANMQSVGEFYKGNQSIEIFNDYSGTNGITIEAGSVREAENIIFAGVNQNIVVGGNNAEILRVYMFGDTNSIVLGNNDFAIRSSINGYNNVATHKFGNSHIIGSNNNTTNVQNSLVIGHGSVLNNTSNCYVVGYNNSISGGTHITAFGTGARCNASTYAENGACAIGANPTINNSSTAIAFGMSSSYDDHNGMKLTTAGDLNVYGAVHANQGADYAEYEEWKDGNENGEDRRGRFVMETGAFIRLANADDDAEDVLGVVSASPTICGDAHGMNWKGRFKKDVFGGLVYKDQEFTDAEGNTKVITAEVESDDYDITREYIPRSERQEFSPIAYIGKIVMVDDGTCEADGYCKSSDNGIATKSDNRTRFRVRKRIDSTHILVRIR